MRWNTPLYSLFKSYLTFVQTNYLMSYLHNFLCAAAYTALHFITQNVLSSSWSERPSLGAFHEKSIICNEKVSRFEKERKENAHFNCWCIQLWQMRIESDLHLGWVVGLFSADDGSFCTLCAFLKEWWCQKQILPCCQLFIIIIMIPF